jgi:toxin FitB
LISYSDELQGRVQSFDQPAAVAAGAIAAERQHAGGTLEIRDGRIAGITTVRRATLATRNTPSTNLRIDLVNPWSS